MLNFENLTQEQTLALKVFTDNDKLMNYIQVLQHMGKDPNTYKPILQSGKDPSWSIPSLLANLRKRGILDGYKSSYGGSEYKLSQAFKSQFSAAV